MWLRFIGDLHEWKHGRSLFRLCFWLSLFPTVEMIMTNTPIWSAYMRLGHANIYLHTLLSLFEVTALLAALLLWVAMFERCITAPRHLAIKGIWAILFLFGIWWTAEIYYIIFYSKRRRDPDRRSAANLNSRQGVCE
jgi:hypothetical protein